MDSESNVTSTLETATAWHDCLLRDPVSDETRNAFAAWIAESATNREQYESVDRMWSALQNAAEDPQILALRHETALRLTRQNTAAVRPLRWIAAAALFAIVMVAANLLLPVSGHQSLIARLFDSLPLRNGGHYETATGERLAFALRDGSQVTLDTQSELQVNFSQLERRVRLARGQAFFEVAKDARRPFVVEVNHRRFIAVGTAFDVRVDGDRVKVTMVEGTVRVEIAEAAQPATGSRQRIPAPGRPKDSTNANITSPEALAIATIIAGEQLVTDTQRGDRVRAADPDRDTSWRRGQIIFDNTRLADAIEELNRYSDSQIELADPALADLRLSGAFATGQPSAFVEAITAYFPLKISRSDERGVVLSEKK